jgi:peptidoglycan LD-endopeptidase LytH
VAALMVAVAVSGCAARRQPQPSAVAPVLSPEEEHSYLIKRELMVPVAGVRPDQVPDTYFAARSGGRTHRALDILAPRGTPVIAADAGRVLRLRIGGPGGVTVFAVDSADRYVYYYAHLDRYVPSLAEGQDLIKGQIIGYVGTTGNAAAEAPHLHFQLMRRPNAARWWDGEPIDPKQYLVLTGHVAQTQGSR